MNKNLLPYIASKIINKSNHGEIVQLVVDIINQTKDQLIGNWHPLGFLHIKLGVVQNIGTVRLHIWLPHNRRRQEPHMPIHDHVFTLNSHILSGTVTNHLYEIVQGDSYTDHKLYKVNYEGGLSILEEADEWIKYKLTSKRGYYFGDYYTVEIGDFHSTTVPIGNFASTVVLTTEHNNHIKPKVVGPINGESKYFYERNPCSSYELRDILETFMKHLNRNTP